MLREAFAEHSVGWTAAFERNSRFKAGRVSLEDDECSGQPSTSKMTVNFEKIRELVHENHCQTTHELADTTGISYGVGQEILTENLNMHCTAAKFVPRLLTNYQKRWHLNMCLELQEKASEGPTFISRIITADESWIYGYGSATKQQSSKWKSQQSPRAKKVQQVRIQQRECSFFFQHEGDCSP
jgi:hypothetical protein